MHLHDQVNDVVHVHDKGATWGNFFENIGYALSSNLLKTSNGTYVETANKKVVFVLNGNEIENAANEVINSEDKLLIYYGEEDEAKIKSSYEQINNDAAEFNGKSDPSSCGGGEVEPLTERLKRVIFE